MHLIDINKKEIYNGCNSSTVSVCNLTYQGKNIENHVLRRSLVSSLM